MSNQDYYQNPPPPNYGQQSSSLAVISLIAGITSFIFLPLIGAIAAIITGSMAKKEIRQSAGRLSGLGMANWGCVFRLDQYWDQCYWRVLGTFEHPGRGHPAVLFNSLFRI